MLEEKKAENIHGIWILYVHENIWFTWNNPIFLDCFFYNTIVVCICSFFFCLYKYRDSVRLVKVLLFSLMWEQKLRQTLVKYSFIFLLKICFQFAG